MPCDLGVRSEHVSARRARCRRTNRFCSLICRVWQFAQVSPKPLVAAFDVEIAKRTVASLLDDTLKFMPSRADSRKPACALAPQAIKRSWQLT